MVLRRSAMDVLARAQSRNSSKRSGTSNCTRANTRSLAHAATRSAAPTSRYHIEISLSEGTWALARVPDAISAVNDSKQRSIATGALTLAQQCIDIAPTDTVVVSSIGGARSIAAQLQQQQQQLKKPANDRLVHAIDTEVAHLDVHSETPIHHGELYCMSVYCGPNARFTIGDTCGNRVWIDLNKPPETKAAMLEALRPYLQNENVPKVWHNYGFDRHVFENYGISPAGFAADTMHMARLENPSRKKGYKLDQLTSELVQFADNSKPVSNSMSSFQKPKLKKDGTESAVKYMPSVDELQNGEDREQWINYSTYDALLTWHLFDKLDEQLRSAQPRPCEHLRRNGLWKNSGNQMSMNMWQFYKAYWAPFGNMLTEMEKTGVYVDKQQLRVAEEHAKEDKRREQDRFRQWATMYVPGAEYMNVNSGPQIRQLLFKSKDDVRTVKVANPDYEAWLQQQQNKEQEDLATVSSSSNGLTGQSVGNPSEVEHMLKHNGREPGGDNVGPGEEPEAPSTSESPTDGSSQTDSASSSKSKKHQKKQKKEKPPKKWMNVELHGTGANVKPPSKTATGEAQVSASSLHQLAGSKEDVHHLLERIRGADKSYMHKRGKELKAQARKCGGTIYQPFESLHEKQGDSEHTQVRRGLEACEAVHALCDAIAVDHLLSNFIEPLQSDSLRSYANPFFGEDGMDEGRVEGEREGRVHCSLNINTETGRLSAKRPNLQNQPALAKDRYNIRRSFRAEEGRRYVVADYGQLELRLLAHMTQCHSMLEAFRSGGDFHSRTAVDMFDYIKDALHKEQAVLEWDGEGEPPVPVVKDLFADERKKAKVLNFSIAYGKTAYGLANDWRTSVEEADATLNKWYESRPEVQEWQQKQQELAMSEGCVYTLLGRRRFLPDAKKGNESARRHALRAAINSPIQGGAADIVSLAMLNIRERLPEYFPEWRVVLQVHDEVILEGPAETAEAVEREVVECMSKPFKKGRDFHNQGDELANLLDVDLSVDSKIGSNWMECK